MGTSTRQSPPPIPPLDLSEGSSRPGPSAAHSPSASIGSGWPSSPRMPTSGGGSRPSSIRGTGRSRSASGGCSGRKHEDDSDNDSLYTADDMSDSSRASIGLDEGEEEFELEEGLGDEAAEPLVRRRRKKFDDEPGDKSLLELVAPLILAHPMAIFPVLSNVPTDFLPAGVALFIPLFCVIAALSACAHIVIVYLSWYLKVRTFEDVFAACVGERFGKYGLVVGRAFVLVATMGATIGCMGSVHQLLQPMIAMYLPKGVFGSRILWTIIPGLLLTPIVIPSRTLKSLRIAPVIVALLLPLVSFIMIGRTVEVTKAAAEAGEAIVAAAVSAIDETPASSIARRGLGGLVTGSAGSGLSTLVMFFSPHLLTLPVHSTLTRNQRQKFGIPCLAAGIIIIVLALPAALVPYYLLPEGPSSFSLLPADDGWVNCARVLMAVIVLGSITMWLLRGRDTILAALGVESGAERNKASRWVGMGMWAIVVGFACIGGAFADKMEILGVIATIAVGWLLPSVFFIITFHVRSPLAIIFPSHAPPPAVEDDPRSHRSHGNGHIRTSSLTDPTADVLLARKERQLQKRRLGRRLWQDLIVYAGILPVGCISLAWCIVSLVSVW